MTERNSQQYAGDQTQSWNNTTSRLLAVRKSAQKDKKRQFINLMHHVTVDLLKQSMLELKKKSAAGVDGVTWQSYDSNLEENLKALYEKVQSGRYRPKPARRVYIPKMDGGQRPLSIICFEDKIVQQAVATLLNQIYETDFLGFSYGFRSGRSQHDALDALAATVYKKKVNWVLDLDISKFFDTVEHSWLIRFIEHRIKDKRLLRLLRQWLHAGVVDEHGHRVPSKIGTPQGAVISPLLANIYLHYVFDLWANQWRKARWCGEMTIVRYADDVVLGFQRQGDAEFFLRQLRPRLAKFGLAMHPEKTRLIRFGRFAAKNSHYKGLGKPETFDFLGFTHYCGKTRNGMFCLKRKTIRKRLHLQIKSIGKELMRRRHELPLKNGAWLTKVVQGHINYYGVPFNSKSLSVFCWEIKRRWYKSLCRRSQRKKVNWEKFGPFTNLWIPMPKIVHPYPEERFFATTRGRSRMH